MVAALDRRYLGQFAKLLEYPHDGQAAMRRACDTLLAVANSDAALSLAEFRTFLDSTGGSRLEEIFTSTFDLEAAYHPYVGYHLFGESYKRSVFLLGLKERFRAQGFTIDQELPDHLAVLLRFLASTDDADMAREIVHEAVLPALERMLGKAKSAGYEEELPAGSSPETTAPERPYRSVLEALRATLLDWSDAGETPVHDATVELSPSGS